MPSRATAAGRQQPFKAPRYLCFSDVRTFLSGMPILDWLERYGSAHGYTPDPQVRTDFSSFVMKCGIRFETWVVESALRPSIVRVGGDDVWADLSRYNRFQQSKHHEATLEALNNPRVWMLYQPFVVDEAQGWFGHPDLVVRRDCLPLLETVLDSARENRASDLSSDLSRQCEVLWKNGESSPHPGWAIVDVKYSSTLTNKPLYQAQLWIYLRAINSMLPDQAEPVCIDDLYLLGRAGELVRAFSRLSQLDQVVSSLADAREWQRTVDMVSSAEWNVVPVPSVRELQVSATRDESGKWDAVLDRIAFEQGDVCSVYKVGPALRSKLPFPPLPWWNDLCTAKYLNVNEGDERLVNEMLMAARKVRNHDVVPNPTKLSWVQALGTPRAIRWCVIAFDFEFVYDLHRVESFKSSTQSWVFCIASDVVSSSTSSHSGSFVDCVRSGNGELNDQGELELMERWLTWLKQQQRDTSTVYMVHWSPAEVQCIKRTRHKVRPGTTLSELFVWWDRCVVLVDAMTVLRTRQVVVPGAMEYGLKAVYANLFRTVSPPQPPVIHLNGTGPARKRSKQTVAVPDREHVVATPANSTRAPELSGTGLAGDMAALVAYDLAQSKQFTEEPNDAMRRVMNYNMDDVRMTAAIWTALVKD